ncbi:hypothetical protein [Pseudomonas sp. PNPG3]|uniref:hypothetical protein n=1 Tax=Pseudomonas sp. PNPG3 TaxID=2919497 RepID=UPI001FFC9D31|nr:hypothetical protein [Pseudomonas sp. PNPG3]MCK2122130.1 hypothetical protein [Pseudomonas sp. PNPG3]
MTVPFSRTVNKRSAVQLNPINDQSEQPSVSTVAHNMAITGRFSRGRIDKAFAVSRGKESRILGAPQSLAVSKLGEAYVHISEALKKGTVQAVVSRLVSDSAVNRLLVASSTTSVGDVWSLVEESVGASGGYLIALKHLECFSEGVRAEINARGAQDAAGAAIDSKIIVLQLRDVVTNAIVLGPYEGSLDPTALDEFGQSFFIGDIVSQSTDLLEVVDVAADAKVSTDSAFYGKKDNKDVFASKDLKYFTEGDTVYTTAELDKAINRLKRARPSFTYIGSGGTENVALINRLLGLGADINKQVAWDIPGRLTPEAAVTFYESVGGATDSLYSQCYWAPISANNPVIGGKAIMGTSGQQIGYRCARNAQTNAKGIAPRNFPIAGSDYAIDRTNMSQVYEPEVDELELLAASRINPAIFMDYPSGPKYAWIDSLTGAQTEGASKLINVTEMATYVDDTLASAAQEKLQKPMAKAIEEMTKFGATFLESIQSAGWLQPSAELDGASYKARFEANANQPFEKMNIGTWICYDGTNRVTEMQQSIVRT